MKHFIALMSGMLVSAIAVAQIPYFNEYDAAKIASTDISGTARYIGLGGAMSALGGDASSLSNNPAGLGVYRSSEISLTMGGEWTKSAMDGNDDTRSGFVFPQFGCIGTFQLKNTNAMKYFQIAVGMNRTKSFKREVGCVSEINHSIGQLFAEGLQGTDTSRVKYDNVQLPFGSVLSYTTFLVNPLLSSPSNYISLYDENGYPSAKNRSRLIESGCSNDFHLSLGGNINDLIFWGMSFILNQSDYDLCLQYDETYTQASYMNSDNYFKMMGTGFTYKLGLIAKPVHWLRLGASFHTPTLWRIKTANSGAMSVYDPTWKGDDANTPEYIENLRLSGPLNAVAGVAIVLGKVGLLSVDYQYANYHGMRVRNTGGRKADTTNETLQENINDTHTLRAGLEVKPLEWLSLRLGGGYSTPMMKKDAARWYYSNETRTDYGYYNILDNYYITAGLGFRFGRHAIDLGYIHNVSKADYYAFNPINYGISTSTLAPIGIESKRNQIVMSYAVRF